MNAFLSAKEEGTKQYVHSMPQLFVLKEMTPVYIGKERKIQERGNGDSLYSRGRLRHRDRKKPYWSYTSLLLIRLYSYHGH